MKRVTLYKAINKENKYYGMKAIGLGFGAISFVVVWMILDQTIGIIAALAGYTLGCWLSSLWHEGIVQRWLYWNLPISRLIGGKRLPPSYYRRFM